MEAWRWLGPLEDMGLSPVGWKLPRDEDFTCGIGLTPQKQWMSGCGEAGAQEGAHISRAGFQQEAGGSWKLEREQVLSDGCGISQKTRLLLKCCRLPSGHGILFSQGPGVGGPNFRPSIPFT